MDGWKTIVSFWGVSAYFQVLLQLVAGRVNDRKQTSPMNPLGVDTFARVGNILGPLE